MWTCRISRSLGGAPPEGHRVSSAELFYLHHMRSCAAGASGAQSGHSQGSSSCPAKPAWLPQPGPCTGAVLDAAFFLTSLVCDLMLRGLLFAMRSDVWLPACTGGLLHGALRGQVPALQISAAVSGNPVPWMASQSVLYGGWRAVVGFVALGAMGCDAHVRPWACRLCSAGVVAAGSGALDTWTSGLLLAFACQWPAFPGVPASESAGPPPAPHPAPPARRDLRVTTWGVDVMQKARGCHCHALTCKGPIRRGDIRAFSTTLAHKLFYHPECVEGGLGPYDEVVGTDALAPPQQDVVRNHCDQPGRPTRAEHVQDVLRAKRARYADPGGAPADPNAPLQQPDDGHPGDLPEELESGEGRPEFSNGAIPNLAWWESVSYTSLAHDVPTVLRVPDEVSQALALLRGRVATTLNDALATGDMVTLHRAEKLFTFFDRVFLVRSQQTRGGRKVKGRGLSIAITSRLRLAATGDWGSLWRAAMTTGARRPRRGGRRPTPEEDAREVETLLKEGLISKAMVRATGAAAVAHGPEVPEALQALFPDGETGTHPGPAPAAPDEETKEALVEAVKRHLRRSPKRSGPGPNGSRFEHWRTVLSDSEAATAVARVVVLFLYGALSPQAMEANLGARLVALRKPSGGLRPIACGGVIRRLAGKAACDVFKDEIWNACGARQYAVGRRAGCELVHKTLAALTEACPNGVVLSFDATNAFNSIPRSRVMDGVAARAPSLYHIVQAWLGANPTTHFFWNDADAATPIRAKRGVDRGCPLSPGLFAIALADALGDIAADLQRLSPECRVFSYLDDIMVFGPPEHADAAIQIVIAALTRAGLQVNQTKTKAWTKNPEVVLPPTAQRARVDTLTCLGNTATWLEQAEERVRVHAGADGDAAVAKATAFRARLGELRTAGLSAEGAWVLLRTFAQGAVTHHLRAAYNLAWTDTFDDAVFGCLEDLLQAPLDDTQRLQATLRLVDGGCALPSAKETAPAAYAASWALVMQDVARGAGFASWEEFRTRCPLTLQSLQQAEAALRAQGALGDDPFEWLDTFQEPQLKLQGQWGKERSSSMRQRLLGALGEDDRLQFRGAGGPGAGGFLLPREEGDQSIPDKHFLAAYKKR